MTQPRVPDLNMQRFDLHGLSMGTNWQVQCYVQPHLDHETLQVGIQTQLDQVVAQMSPWEANSNISQFNRAPANSWHVLPTEFFKVLQHSLFVAEQTQGAYDPSIGHLANLWGFGPAGKITAVPDAAAISQALALTQWRCVQINPENQSALQTGNIHLDLCSTAKGFGVDHVARYLQQLDIHSYLVEVGGELRGLGCKADGQPWWVELEELPESNKIPCIAALHGLAIATSGDYRRYFEIAGQRYSHSIDPRNGYPVPHGVASVTVLHPECMIADALATAMTVLGLERGMEYAKQLHVAARFIVREADTYRQTLSPALMAMLD
ncbi:MAG: FAD:protein FMN transferase [Undibacterium sp.]|nr:FAD:protein FMN transferase [Undibacterium sp.]